MTETTADSGRVADPDDETFFRLVNAGGPAPFDLARPGRILLATLSAAAGFTHVAMVPSHMDEAALLGIGFGVAGWLQIGLAAVLISRPRRWVLWTGVAMQAAFIVAWVVSRTAGLPFGEHAWHAESAAFVDSTTVALEGAFVLAAAALLERPHLGSGWSRRWTALASVIPLALLVLATAAVASPSARQHNHGDEAAGAGHDHGEEAVSDHEHDTAASAAASSGDAGDGHDHDAVAADDDRGLSLLQNGHQHEAGVVEVDSATQAQLSVQLAATAELIRLYPTVADAEAAGYWQAGPFSPGLGTHFVGPRSLPDGDGVIADEDMLNPVLIYDGTSDDSPIAGFMYLAGGAVEPEGFVGPNDHWHFHTNVCVVYANGRIETPLGADTEATSAQCEALGGTLLENTGYMVHVWTVPGYESNAGVFHELNDKLTCPDGSYYMMSMDEYIDSYQAGQSDSVCLSG